MADQMDQAAPSGPSTEELEERAKFGADVRRFLGDPLWEHGYRATKTAYVNAIVKSPPGPDGTAHREAIHAEMAALDRMYGTLQQFVQQGIEAEDALAAMHQSLMSPPKDVPHLIDDQGNVLRAN